jgi:hypothetical protein
MVYTAEPRLGGAGNPRATSRRRRNTVWIAEDCTGDARQRCAELAAAWPWPETGGIRRVRPRGRSRRILLWLGAQRQAGRTWRREGRRDGRVLDWYTAQPSARISTYAGDLLLSWKVKFGQRRLGLQRQPRRTPPLPLPVLRGKLGLHMQFDESLNR